MEGRTPLIQKEKEREQNETEITQKMGSGRQEDLQSLIPF